MIVSYYLCGMLADSVTSIDNRDRGKLGRQLGAADVWVPNNDSIPVASESADSVGQTFAFRYR